MNILVNNSKAADIGIIRPCIKNIKLKLVRVVEGEYSYSPKCYVVNYNGEEVYLRRDEFELIKRRIKK